MFKIGDAVCIREDANFWVPNIRGVDALVAGEQRNPHRYLVTFVDGGYWEEWSTRRQGAWVLPEELEMRVPRVPDWEI